MIFIQRNDDLNNERSKKTICKKLLSFFSIFLVFGFILGIVVITNNKYDSSYIHINAIVNNCTFHKYIKKSSKSQILYAEYYLFASININNITYRCVSFTDKFYNISDAVSAYISTKDNDCILFNNPISNNYVASVVGMCFLLLVGLSAGLAVCLI